MNMCSPHLSIFRGPWKSAKRTYHLYNARPMLYQLSYQGCAGYRFSQCRIVVYSPILCKSTHWHSQKRASCSKSAAGLLPCCHRTDIRMRSASLDDNKPAASCQQPCCKLIVKTFYSQTRCNSFQQFVASLQLSSCNKSDFHRLAATWWSLQICCNLLTTCSMPAKFTTFSKSVTFLAV